MCIEFFRPSRTLPFLIGLLLIGAGSAAAQVPEVISKQISLGRAEATLRLEFEAGDPLEVSFLGGAVQVNGAALGASTPELDAAWRALLGQVATLEEGDLVRALIDWAPPASLQDDARALGDRLDSALEEALADASSPPRAPAAPQAPSLAALLARPDRLPELAAALEGVRLGDLRLHVSEPVEVSAGETIAATLLVVDGDLIVRGTVDGDVVVVGGTIRLAEGGRVSGDVRLADSRLYREGGEIFGDAIEVETPSGVDVSTRTRIREEIRREIRNEVTRESRGGSLFSPLRNVTRGVSGVFSNLVTALVLTLLGGVVLHFAGNNLEVVAETARRGPGRAAAVGVAGTFLALPVWLFGTVALAISIIGIPVALLWLPLFPVALGLAAALGYFAVARNIGAWVARQRFPYFEWVRTSNSVTLVAGGVVALMGAFVISNVLAIAGPWLGFLRGLFIVAGVGGTLAAALIGFGAVLITRGGSRFDFYSGAESYGVNWDDDLSSATDSEPQDQGGV